ncbi:unnamed protein product [Lymnaea stagnalis]|uniref:Little elongation complex subunit 1 C-terminal domain-containing protein n=1 Tax=Lymnaea stagnalis TaxID=6523 RepID=A0AAV2IJF1_LYMST
MAIAGVWPEVFSHNHVTRQCAMSPVLDYLLRDTYKSHPKVLRQVQCVLQRLCSWDTRQTTVQPEKLLKTLYEKLLFHFANEKHSLNPGYIFEVSKAIELLLIYQGAAWTMGNFTQRILLSLAMKWEHNGDTEKGPSPELVVAMMGVFRAVIAVQPLLVNSPKMISQIFERFIDRKSTNMSVELAYVNALLEISPYNPEKCLDLLRKWQDNNKGKVPNQTFSNFLQVRTMLSQKSGRGRDSKR